MHEIGKFKHYVTFVTNGEVSFPLEAAKHIRCGMLLPKGVTYSEDGDGNEYINGKPMHFEIRPIEEEW